MKKCWGIVFVLFVFALNQVQADDTLQLRQIIAGNFIGGLYRNNQNWGIEIQNTNKPSLLFGAGPRWTKNFSPNKEIKCFGYLAIVNDVSKKHWPAEKMEIDTFIIPSIGKWKFFSRTKAQYFFTNQAPCYFGEDAIGYQISEKWQFQLRSEWKCQKELTQSLGIGWINKFPAASFNGYIGIETKKTYRKAGWIELKFTK